MKKLDKGRPFGTITPLYIGKDFDRPAQYEQDGCFFDAHGRQIIPGKPLAAPKPAQAPAPRHPLDHDGDGRPGGSVAAGDVDKPMPIDELIAKADELAWPSFKKHAKLILGEGCPAGKKAIIAELSKAREKYLARKAKGQPASESSSGSKPSQSAVNTGSIDLAAWARGQRDYLFGEIQKTIRSAHHRQVTERRDAVDFLIEQGVIREDEARRDV